MTLPTPFSYTQFDGDGSETSFSFTWDYISKEDVKVYLDTTLVNEGTGASEWQWDGDKKIKMGTAPAAGTKLTIRRETPEDKQIVQWTDGSHLIADDLNKSDRQWLYLAEEHHDVIIRIIWGLPPVPGPGLPDDLFGLWNRLARNKDSNKGTTDEVAQTIDKTDQLKGDAVPGSVQNGEDSYVLTLGAVSERLDLVKGDGSSYPGTGNVGHLGKLRVNSSNKLFFWDQTLATPAWVEIIGGSAGPPGAAATIAVGTTTTLDAGNPATVSNSGTSSAAVFDFGIPKGPKGDPGAAGTTPTVAAGTTTTLAAGSSATVTNSGTSTAAVFDFGIPKGDKGDTGSALTAQQRPLRWERPPHCRLAAQPQSPTPVHQVQRRLTSASRKVLMAPALAPLPRSSKATASPLLTARPRQQLLPSQAITRSLSIQLASRSRSSQAVASRLTLMA